LVDANREGDAPTTRAAGPTDLALHGWSKALAIL
jgi:hypothetical protein